MIHIIQLNKLITKLYDCGLDYISFPFMLIDIESNGVFWLKNSQIL